MLVVERVHRHLVGRRPPQVHDMNGREKVSEAIKCLMSRRVLLRHYQVSEGCMYYARGGGVDSWRARLCDGENGVEDGNVDGFSANRAIGISTVGAGLGSAATERHMIRGETKSRLLSTTSRRRPRQGGNPDPAAANVIAEWTVVEDQDDDEAGKARLLAIGHAENSWGRDEDYSRLGG